MHQKRSYSYLTLASFSFDRMPMDISLSIPAIMPRYGGHCIWNGNSCMGNKLGSSSSVYLCNDRMGVCIWCSHLFPIFALLHSNNAQTCWETSKTFCGFLTKKIFRSDGLMRSFCQNSCWSIPIETVNQDTQTVSGKEFSLKPTAVTKYYFSTEFRSTALLCGMIHYTNSSS